MVISIKLLFSKVSEGVKLFQGGGGGGVHLFLGLGGGGQMLISKEIYITCDFPGGGGSGPPIPLWIRTCDFTTYFYYFKRKH